MISFASKADILIKQNGKYETEIRKKVNNYEQRGLICKLSARSAHTYTQRVMRALHRNALNIDAPL